MKKLTGSTFLKATLLVMAITSSSAFAEQLNPSISPVQMHSVSTFNGISSDPVSNAELEKLNGNGWFSKKKLQNLFHKAVQKVANTALQAAAKAATNAVVNSGR
jgi:hypothetical protein